jgi:TIM-barrel protein
MLDFFDLRIRDKRLKSPVAIASMAGITNAEYVKKHTEWIGLACIGGYAIDEKTLQAAAALADAGRKEFLAENQESALDIIENEVKALKDTDVLVFVNLRASNEQSLTAAAKRLGSDIGYEIDAHCRQAEMIQAGCGEYLLTHTNILAKYITALKGTGVIVSVKIRTGVSANDAELARLIWKAGADIIHVDCMDAGAAAVRKIRNACPLLIIGNNSINTFEAAKTMFSHGADIVSLARMANPKVLAVIYEQTAKYAKEVGWYNAPKQLCRGGDIRALTFCCPPVKPCPLMPFLQKIGITPQEFVDMKNAGAGLALLAGQETCFGSMIYCCKSSTPCFGRDRSLRQNSMSKQAFMQEKRNLADNLLSTIFTT